MPETPQEPTKLLEDGILGKATITRLQEYLGTT